MQQVGTALVVTLGFSSLVSIAAVAAEPGTDATAETTDVVALCGEEALTLTTEIVALPADQAAKLDALLAQMVTAEGAAEANVPPAPGLALRVETPDGIYARAVGVADVETCESLQADSLFQIGSNTKMMTASSATVANPWPLKAILPMNWKMT